MKKILIVGKNSYIGTQFENYVERFDQQGDSYDTTKVSASNGEWKEVDYSEYQIVILLSGIVHQKESVCGYDMYHKVNYEMALEIARKAKAANVKQFIFFSTMAVFGDGVTRIDHNTKLQPTTFYGKTKLMAEQEMMKLSDQDFVVSVVRPPMVYGKGCKGNFKRLEGLVGKLFLFPRLTNRRSMIYIENLCEFLRLLCEVGRTQVYHPQNQAYVSTCGLVREIGRQKNRKILMVPGFGGIIHFAMKYVRSVQKLFGDCYYEKEMSVYENMDYWIVDERESIKRSI